MTTRTYCDLCEADTSSIRGIPVVYDCETYYIEFGGMGGFAKDICHGCGIKIITEGKVL